MLRLVTVCRPAKVFLVLLWASRRLFCNNNYNTNLFIQRFLLKSPQALHINKRVMWCNNCELFHYPLTEGNAFRDDTWVWIQQNAILTLIMWRKWWSSVSDLVNWKAIYFVIVTAQLITRHLLFLKILEGWRSDRLHYMRCFITVKNPFTGVQSDLLISQQQ